jgi:hypothetical protein
MLSQIKASVLFFSVFIFCSGQFLVAAISEAEQTLFDNWLLSRYSSREQFFKALKYGGNVDGQDAYGNTPLWNQSYDGDLLRIQELLKAQADVDKKNNRNETPIFLVTKINGSDQILQEILNAGADVNIVNNVGNTALHEAVRYAPGLNKIDLLLRSGADLSKKNVAGQTPEDVALSYPGHLDWDTRCDRVKKAKYLQFWKIFKNQNYDNTLVGNMVAQAYRQWLEDGNPVGLATYFGMDPAVKLPNGLAAKVKNLFPLDRDRIDPVLDEYNNQVIDGKGKPVVQFVHEGEPSILPELRRDYQDYQAKQIQKIGRAYLNRKALKKA